MPRNRSRFCRPKIRLQHFQDRGSYSDIKLRDDVVGCLVTTITDRPDTSRSGMSGQCAKFFRLCRPSQKPAGVAGKTARCWVENQLISPIRLWPRTVNPTCRAMALHLSNCGTRTSAKSRTYQRNVFVDLPFFVESLLTLMNHG